MTGKAVIPFMKKSIHYDMLNFINSYFVYWQGAAKQKLGIENCTSVITNATHCIYISGFTIKMSAKKPQAQSFYCQNDKQTILRCNYRQIILLLKVQQFPLKGTYHVKFIFLAIKLLFFCMCSL